MGSQVYDDKFYDLQIEGSLASARTIVPLVCELFSPHTVVDVGCGLGTWLSIFKQHGVHRVTGIDGDYVSRKRLLIAEEEFISADVTKPLSIGNKFDLAVSLEVAEHIPIEHAPRFASDLCQLAPLILFSAAPPGQGGSDHINEQWPSYWECLFKRNSYTMFDPIRKRVWGNENVCFWYRQNIFMFVDDNLLARSKDVQTIVSANQCADLLMVHPKVFDAALGGIRPCLRRLVELVKRKLFFAENQN